MGVEDKEEVNWPINIKNRIEQRSKHKEEQIYGNKQEYISGNAKNNQEYQFWNTKNRE